MRKENHVKIGKWKDGKRFAYSIIYDEGFVEVLKNALPTHEKYGYPRLVAMVVGQIGQIRRIKGSAYNRYRHMSVSQLKILQNKGWSVGNHSLTHMDMRINTYNEVVQSRIIDMSPGLQ